MQIRANAVDKSAGLLKWTPPGRRTWIRDSSGLMTSVMAVLLLLPLSGGCDANIAGSW